MSEQTKQVNVPLSQAPGRKKIVVAIPGALIFAILCMNGIFEPITKFLALALCAYAFVGGLEILFGESLASSAKKWDSLAGWKKFLISLLVILIALVGFLSLMPVLAPLI